MSKLVAILICFFLFLIVYQLFLAYFKPFLFENAHSGAFSSAKSNFATCIFNARRCNMIV